MALVQKVIIAFDLSIRVTMLLYSVSDITPRNYLNPTPRPRHCKLLISAQLIERNKQLVK